MYDRTITFTGRELVYSMCFASDSDTKSDPAVEVNNATINDANNKNLPWRCLVVSFFDASSGLRIPSALPRGNKCWSVSWFRSHL